MTASARLERKIELVLPGLATPGYLLLRHARARELYPRYLTVGYYFALTMVPLMEAAVERARALAPGDPVAAGLAEYLERHIPEEMHADDPGGAMLDDLKAIGVDTVALRAEPAPAKIAALIGAQYFWIFHSHPVAVLGFLTLETYHPHGPTVEQLIEKTGLPRDGFRQLLMHAEVDVAHADDLYRALDSLPLEFHHEQMIGRSALHTIALLTDTLLDIVGGTVPVSADG